MRWLILSLVSLASLGVFAAAGQEPEVLHNVTITIRDRAFIIEPDTRESQTQRLTTPVMSTWTNEDAEAHFIQSNRKGGEVIGRIEPGQSVTFELHESGKFECAYHLWPDMKLAVLGIWSSGTPSATPVPSALLKVRPPVADETNVEVYAAQVTEPFMVVLLDGDSGSPGEVRGASPLLQPNQPVAPILLSKPYATGDTAWISLVSDANGNRTFDGLDIDPPKRSALGNPERNGEILWPFLVEAERPPTPAPGPGDHPGYRVEALSATSDVPAPPAFEANRNAPSTFSILTTTVSASVLVGAITWSFWSRRRKRT